MIWNADHTQRHPIVAVRRPGCSSLDATGQTVCGVFVDRSTR